MAKFSKKVLLFFLGLFLLGSVTTETLAHEMYYMGSSPISLKWNNIVSGRAQLKINGDNLSSFYTSSPNSYYSIARDSWNGAAGKVSCMQESFSSATVRFYTADATLWEFLFGLIFQYDFLGLAEIFSPSNAAIIDEYSAINSQGKIAYANILLTPYTSSFTNVTSVRYTMCHEIGHVLGLGHPDIGNPNPSTPQSIMLSSFTNQTYYSPQQHDLDDLTAKY
ncbi:MAG: hypothetical protein LBH95_04770 [Oscillospiraceae bacterium]|jgi:hypothetical protein|nr:hypothetical protein [Oscillospiraceae bacterium]